MHTKLSISSIPFLQLSFYILKRVCEGLGKLPLLSLNPELCACEGLGKLPMSSLNPE